MKFLKYIFIGLLVLGCISFLGIFTINFRNDDPTNNKVGDKTEDNIVDVPTINYDELSFNYSIGDFVEYVNFDSTYDWNYLPGQRELGTEYLVIFYAERYDNVLIGLSLLFLEEDKYMLCLSSFDSEMNLLDHFDNLACFKLSESGDIDLNSLEIISSEMFKNYGGNFLVISDFGVLKQISVFCQNCLIKE